MTLLRQAFSRSAAAAYAAYATLSTPAFAQDTLSSLHIPNLHAVLAGVSTRDMMLYGGLALLVVVLVAALARRSRDDGTASDGPDMRWWKNY